MLHADGDSFPVSIGASSLKHSSGAATPMQRFKCKPALRVCNVAGGRQEELVDIYISIKSVAGYLKANAISALCPKEFTI